MASRYSKKTLALREQFPDMADWIVGNLTPSQLIAIMESPRGTVWFGEGNPLNSQELAVQLWRAHRRWMLFELRCRYGEGQGFEHPPSGCDRLAYFHEMVCTSIALHAVVERDVVERIVERQRHEIESASGPAGGLAVESDTARSPNRL